MSTNKKAVVLKLDLFLCTDMTRKRDDFKLGSSLVLCHFYMSNYNVQQSVLFLQKFVTMGATFEGVTGASFETRKKKLFLFCLSCVTL